MSYRSDKELSRSHFHARCISDFSDAQCAAIECHDKLPVFDTQDFAGIPLVTGFKQPGLITSELAALKHDISPRLGVQPLTRL